jgi:hypothetical protein
MYQIVKGPVARGVLARETLPFVVSLVTAEMFYKFHSFTLECLAFLATWYALSWLLARVVPGREASRSGERP